MARAKKTVLFLCTGNYYRSRFAEVLFDAVAGRLELGWRASSRGLALERGVANVGPMSAAAVQLLQAQGIRSEAFARMPATVTTEELAQADLIICLKEAEHRPLLQERFPGWAERVRYWHIHDVDCGSVDEALAGIEQAVRELAARLRDGRGMGSEVKRTGR